MEDLVHGVEGYSLFPPPQEAEIFFFPSFFLFSLIALTG
jgi:hypothetical protein